VERRDPDGQADRRPDRQSALRIRRRDRRRSRRRRRTVRHRRHDRIPGRGLRVHRVHRNRSELPTGVGDGRAGDDLHREHHRHRRWRRCAERLGGLLQRLGRLARLGRLVHLAPTATPGVASCQLTYTPSAVGSGTHMLTASYAGDGDHAASQGAAARVLSPRWRRRRKRRSEWWRGWWRQHSADDGGDDLGAERDQLRLRRWSVLDAAERCDGGQAPQAGNALLFPPRSSRP